VLFCDVVKSTSLAVELGPERLHDVIERFFAVSLDEVHRYEGTITQFLGDGFLALFGAPIAHEDHARRALLAAVGIRARADLRLRIGINSGLVVVGTIGDDLHMDYSAFGDSVILAARLQAAAGPGEIFVSQATADQASGYFEFEPVPEVVVKERMVAPLRLQGAGGRTSPVDETVGLTPFVGRDGELKVLTETLSSVVHGQGQLVGLTGEAGLGKSRLTFEFCRIASGSVTVLEGRCLSYGSRMPYLPILDVVRTACGVVGGDSPEDTGSKVRQELGALDLPADDASYLLHALGAITSDELATTDPPMILRRTFDAIRHLLLAQARRRPLVLVIEDLHWIDNTSAELLCELADDVPFASMMLLATYRPTCVPAWLQKSCATQIAMRPLSPDASEQVVQWVLGGVDRDVSALVARGEGNPFFLEELASAEVQRIDESGQGAIPETVRDVLAARIDRLAADQKRALQVASVLGREFTLWLAEAVWDGEDVAPLLRDLKRLEFLRENHVVDGPSFVFKHALTRDVAYDGLLEARRAALHGRAGAALEQADESRLYEQYELLAYHYGHSADRERAAHYLTLANRKAASRHAMEEAIGYFYDALAALESLPDSEANRRRRLTLVFDQTPEFHWLHRHREFHELLVRHKPLVDQLRDRAVTGSYSARLSHRQLIFGNYHAALEMASDALEVCDATGTIESAALSCMVMCWASMMLGDYPAAVAAHTEARKRLDVQFEPVWYMYAQVGVAFAYLMSGRWNDALRELEEAADFGRRTSDNGIVSFAESFAAWVCLEQRDWTGASRFTDRAMALAPTVYFRAFAFGFHSDALCHTGHAEQGLPVLREVVPAIKGSGHEMAWIIMAWRLGLAEIEAGNTDEASTVLRQVADSARRSAVPFFGGASRRCLGELAVAAGDVEAGLELIESAVETLRASGSDNELALALAGRGRTYRRTGGEALAEADLRNALAIFERLGTLEEPDRVRADLADRRADGAISELA
jgi:tetratricopeptide (TPR) repeat protein